VELHTKDGSAIDAGCQCIETKHLFLIEGLSEEGKGFALSKKEKEFMSQLGDLSRQIRKKMEVEDWSFKGVSVGNPRPLSLHPEEAKHLKGFRAKSGWIRKIRTKKWKPKKKNNPHGLTKCEKRHPSVRRKLSSCIKELEKRSGCKSPYTNCAINPVAVCRSSIRCPP